MRYKYIIKYATIISVIGFLFGVITTKTFFKINPSDLTAKVFTDNITKNKIGTEENKETTIFFVGDIMMTRGVESSVRKNLDSNYNNLFINLSEFKNADILFGNLEGNVSDIGNNVGSKYSFRMHPLALDALKQAGFDILSFSNNHVGDWNISGFIDTLNRINYARILKTGAGMNRQEAEEPTIIEKNGTRFGFLAFSDVGPNWIEAGENSPGILLASDPNLDLIVRNAKNKCDVLIVSFHWGVEYKTKHNSRQEKLAHTVIDSGADLVIGGHPHVIQDIGEYKGKTIVYSLGNFIFDQSFSKDTMQGMLFIATFLDKDLIKEENKIITLNKHFQPEGIFTKEEIREKNESDNTNCPKPDKNYNDMFLLNLSQNTSLPDIDYIPKNLREINEISSTRENICLIKDARDQFELMVEKAKDDGYSIKANSGFRDYDKQTGLLEDAIKNGNENANIAIAKGGHSEHQLGTAVDLTGESISYITASIKFAETEESEWLEQNASDFGFVLSYPKGKENITGYMYEPWHYRYVGVDNAKKIKEGGLTITEFLKENI